MRKNLVNEGENSEDVREYYESIDDPIGPILFQIARGKINQEEGTERFIRHFEGTTKVAVGDIHEDCFDASRTAFFNALKSPRSKVTHLDFNLDLLTTEEAQEEFFNFLPSSKIRTFTAMCFNLLMENDFFRCCYYLNKLVLTNEIAPEDQVEYSRQLAYHLPKSKISILKFWDCVFVDEILEKGIANSRVVKLTGLSDHPLSEAAARKNADVVVSVAYLILLFKVYGVAKDLMEKILILAFDSVELTPAYFNRIYKKAIEICSNRPQLLEVSPPRFSFFKGGDAQSILEEQKQEIKQLQAEKEALSKEILELRKINSALFSLVSNETSQEIQPDNPEFNGEPEAKKAKSEERYQLGK